MEDYLIDAKYLSAKLFCEPLVYNIELPKRPLTSKQLSRIVSKEMVRLARPFAHREPHMEVTISLPPGEGWSPKRWQQFRERFLHYLSQVTYVTDHCVRRQRRQGEAGARRVNPAQKQDVDLGQYQALAAIHDNTASQHWQEHLCLVDPTLRQVAEINDGFYREAGQWAARMAERDFGRTPDRRMPSGLVLRQKDGRRHIVPAGGIREVGRTYGFKKPRERERKGLSEADKKLDVETGTPAAALRLSKVLRQVSSEEFKSPKEFGSYLSGHRACFGWRKAATKQGEKVYMDFFVDGQPVPRGYTPSTWSRTPENWTKFAIRGQFLGMPVQEQIEELKAQREQSLKTAGFNPQCLKRDASIITRATAELSQLPWKRYFVHELHLREKAERHGKMCLHELATLVRHSLNPKVSGLDSSLFIRPDLGPKQLPIILRGVNRRNLDHLLRDYEPSAVIEHEHGCFSVMILVDAIPARKEWENRLALRRLTFLAAKRYEADPEIVADDGLPLVGFPQLAGSGRSPQLVGPVKKTSCRHATRLLQQAAEGLLVEEDRWWKGKPGWVLDQKRSKYLPGLYIQQLNALSASPIPCYSVKEMNTRAFARMSACGFKDHEIERAFKRVAEIWPELSANLEDLRQEAASCFPGMLRSRVNLPRPLSTTPGRASEQIPSRIEPVAQATGTSRSSDQEQRDAENSFSVAEFIIEKLGAPLQAAENIIGSMVRSKLVQSLEPELVISEGVFKMCTWVEGAVNTLKEWARTKDPVPRVTPEDVAAQIGSGMIEVIETIKRERRAEPLPRHKELSIQPPLGIYLAPPEPSPSASRGETPTPGGLDKNQSAAAVAPPQPEVLFDPDDERSRKDKLRQQRLRMRAAVLAMQGQVAAAEQLLAGEGLPIPSVIALQHTILEPQQNAPERWDELTQWAQTGVGGPPAWLEPGVQAKEQEFLGQSR
jgi:hypothetical protein